ncbi:MAG: hypothetical protein GX117_02005 [Candidatus Hydrogenedentes bacterium]|jgi:predicted amidophosphoribosyltransferase|nr:hypothetical protein [Candidatus Hydrogenedentota bacterium]
MRWFKRPKSGDNPNKSLQSQERFPLVARHAWCSVCQQESRFTRIWRRAAMMGQCPCCQLVFEEPEQLYRRFQPACPRCAEPLEQPQFDYGFCDRCGSKFELMEGAKPGLLPNKRQRDEMNKQGKSWSPI